MGWLKFIVIKPSLHFIEIFVYEFKL